MSRAFLVHIMQAHFPALARRASSGHVAASSAVTFAWLGLPRSLKRHEEIQVQGLRCPRQGCEGETRVIRVEKTIYHGTAGAHSFRKLGPGHAIAGHFRQDLIREDLLLRPEIDLFPNSFHFQKGGKAGPDMLVLHRKPSCSTSFCRSLPSAMSSGAVRAFFTNPCSST